MSSFPFASLFSWIWDEDLTVTSYSTYLPASKKTIFQCLHSKSLVKKIYLDKIIAFLPELHQQPAVAEPPWPWHPNLRTD